jgi:hypothetical protein
MDILAFPFRLKEDGTAVKVVQGSEADHAQKISQLVRTRIGELPLAPAFGITDPTLYRVDAGEIVSGMALYYPEVEIQDVIVYTTDTGRNAVEVVFDSTSTYEVTNNVQ